MECCGKEMQYNDGSQDMLEQHTKAEAWVCLNCGIYFTKIEGVMPIDELEELREQLEG